MGSTVRTKDGRGIVTEVNLLTGMLKVASEKDQAATKYYNKSEVKLVRGDRPAREGTDEEPAQEHRRPDRKK